MICVDGDDVGVFANAREAARHIEPADALGGDLRFFTQSGHRLDVRLRSDRDYDLVPISDPSGVAELTAALRRYVLGLKRLSSEERDMALSGDLAQVMAIVERFATRSQRGSAGRNPA